MAYRTADTRNVCLIGLTHAGKTQLAEALLHAGGAISYCGTLGQGDTVEVAFVQAGRKAFLDAISKASPIIMEPVVDVTVTLPRDCVGGVTGDLSAMRGMVSGTSMRPDNRMEISGQVPLKKIQGYHSRLKWCRKGAL